jgi:hypothetical protein
VLRGDPNSGQLTIAARPVYACEEAFGGGRIRP